MRNFELDKLDMYVTVQTGMIKRKSLWQGISYLVDTMNLLDTNIELIRQAFVIQKSYTTGYTDHKKVARAELEKQMLFIAMQIKSYATISSNTGLYHQIPYNKSSINHSRDKDLVYDADTLHSIATEHLVALTNLGVTPAVLASMQTAIAKFIDAVNTPLVQRQTAKEGTLTLKRLIKETDELLKECLDAQMLIFTSSEPTFYLTYTFNRKINGSPTIKTAMRIKVVDALTKMPLAKARIAIKDHRIKRLTSPHGQIVIRNLKEGEHIVMVTLDGYSSASPTITHIKGETTEVVVEMVRE